MKYLSDMDEEQTLVLCSGHPQGLFPSGRHAPRVVVTNGMVRAHKPSGTLFLWATLKLLRASASASQMVPNYSGRAQYDRLFALGVTLYGQMTAGSFCYIGPQGIVHGTTVRAAAHFSHPRHASRIAHRNMRSYHHLIQYNKNNIFSCTRIRSP